MSSRYLHRVKPHVVAAGTVKTLIVGIADSNGSNGDSGGWGYQCGLQEAAHGELGYDYVGSNLFGADAGGDDAVVDCILQASVTSGWETSDDLTTLGVVTNVIAAGDSNGPGVGLEDGVSAPAGFNNPAIVRSTLQNDWPSWFVPDAWDMCLRYGWTSFGSTGDGALEVALRWNGSSNDPTTHATERGDSGDAVVTMGSLDAPAGTIVAGTGTNTATDRIIFAGRPASKGPSLHNFVFLENKSATKGLHITHLHSVGGETAAGAVSDIQSQDDEYLQNWMGAALLPQASQDKHVIFRVVLGGNDWVDAGTNEAVFKANMQTLIDEIDSLASGAGLSDSEYVILLVGYHPRTASADFGYRIAQYELAGENHNVAFYDPAEYYTIAEMPAWWDGGTDNAHLTDEGYNDLSKTELTTIAAVSGMGGFGPSRSRSRSKSRASASSDYLRG